MPSSAITTQLVIVKAETSSVILQTYRFMAMYYRYLCVIFFSAGKDNQEGDFSSFHDSTIRSKSKGKAVDKSKFDRVTMVIVVLSFEIYHFISDTRGACFVTMLHFY